MIVKTSYARLEPHMAAEVRELAELQRDAAQAAHRAWRFGRLTHAPPLDLARLQGLAAEHRGHLDSLDGMAAPSLVVVGSSRRTVVLARARVVFATRRGWRAVLAALGQAERNLVTSIHASRLAGELENEALVTVVAAMVVTSISAVAWLAP